MSPRTWRREDKAQVRRIHVAIRQRIDQRIANEAARLVLPARLLLMTTNFIGVPGQCHNRQDSRR
jgi:hypothetical protein